MLTASLAVFSCAYELLRNGVLQMVVVAAEVFKNAFIPQKLADIDHYEREIIKMSSTGNNTGCARIVVDSHPYPRGWAHPAR